MYDSSTTVLDRQAVGEAPTEQFWRLVEALPMWSTIDPDPPPTASDARLRPVVTMPNAWSTDVNTLERVLAELRRV